MIVRLLFDDVQAVSTRIAGLLATLFGFAFLLARLLKVLIALLVAVRHVGGEFFELLLEVGLEVVEDFLDFAWAPHVAFFRRRLRVRRIAFLLCEQFRECEHLSRLEVYFGVVNIVSRAEKVLVVRLGGFFELHASFKQFPNGMRNLGK